MDLARVLVPLDIFSLAFVAVYLRLKREQSQAVDPAASMERLNRRMVNHSSMIGLVVAGMLLLAGVAERSLVIITVACALIAFQLWRRSTV